MGFWSKLFGSSSSKQTEPRRQTSVSSASRLAPKQSADSKALLLDGAKTGSMDKVAQALEAGADSNSYIEIQPQNEDPFDIFTMRRNALDIALENGHANIARLLLEEGANLADNRFDQDKGDNSEAWDVVLLDAAKRGHTEVCKIALEHGRDVNCIGLHGSTPLILASAFGKKDTVMFLLARGADVNHWSTDPHHPGKPFRTSLMWARFENHPEVAQVLVEAGAKDATEANASAAKPSNSSLDAAQIDAKHREAEGGKKQAEVKRGPLEYELFNQLRSYRNLGGVLNVLNKGVNVNARDEDGRNALLFLLIRCNHSDADMAQALIDNGIDVNAVDKYGTTALIEAAGRNNTKLVKELLDRGAIVNAVDIDGTTALMRAASYEGIRYSYRGEEGHAEEKVESVSHCDHDLLKALLAKGADVNARNNQGRNALSYALSDDVRAILVEAGAKP